MTTLPHEILRRGRNAFVTVTGPMALTSKSFLVVSVSIHSIKPVFAIPALLTTAHSAKMKIDINFERRKHSINEFQIKMVTLVMY